MRKMWPYELLPKGALDKIAVKALAFQRSTFLRVLQPGRILEPLDPEASKLSETEATRVKEAIDAEADELIAKHIDSLPEDCARAPGHLQMAALAMAAQRTLLREARADGGERYLTASGLKARWAVADALGVVAPPDGTRPYAVPVQRLPNTLALAVTGGYFFESRRRSMTARMMANFETDLGPAFAIEPLEGLAEPSRQLTRCYYHDVLSTEGDDVVTLGQVFTAMHEATWSGVPGFEFECDEDGSGDGWCRFIFR